MYQITCDGRILYDPRKDDLVVINPKCKVEVNTIGEASFSIYADHPNYGYLQKMKPVFEIRQDGEAIFRGRMTNDTKDFYNIKAVDLEGVMGYFNDTIVRPFVFPDDFMSNEEYMEAAATGNVVAFFLKWLIDNHNEKAEPFQQMKLGVVTVADPNNYLSRSSEEYLSTWEVLKTRLFDSALGGYLCIRYEEDGNYIDYLADFELTNTQKIKFGENLLDITSESDASATYSAIVPLGKRRNEIDKDSEDKSRLTIEEIADGDINEDIVKEGDTLYSKAAVNEYGWICAPTAETTWEDVTEADNLLTKGVDYLSNTAIKLLATSEIKAADLHFTDAEIESFRIYRYINVESRPHDHQGRYILSQLDIDIENPQNTIIKIGDKLLSLTDKNAGDKQSTAEKIETLSKQTNNQAVDVTELHQTVIEQSTATIQTCEEIILSALVNYTEKTNYEELKETVEAQLKILGDEISLNFSSLTDHIENVDGDLQSKFNEITKYFTFDINGLTIGQTDNRFKVKIDNDRYSMYDNGLEVWWVANGETHTPKLTVTEYFNLFGYVITEDENGNVNCEYVGE